MTDRCLMCLSPRVCGHPSLSQRVGRDLSKLFASEQRQTTVSLIILWFAICYGSYGISTWILTIFESIDVSVVCATVFLFQTLLHASATGHQFVRARALHVTS